MPSIILNPNILRGNAEDFLKNYLPLTDISNHPSAKIPEISPEPKNCFKSEMIMLPSLTPEEKLAYSTSTGHPNFFVLDEKGNLCQWNMNSRHKVFNWRGVVSPGNIFHFIISPNRKFIYIVYSKNGGMYLSKFDIESRGCVRKYEKFMNIQASYNIRITQSEDFIFILGDEERILVQIDLTHDLIKTRCKEVIHFELNDTSIFAYHLDYNLVELPIIDITDE